MRYPSRVAQGGYGAYNAYITAATRYAALGAPTLYDHPASVYGSKHISHCNFDSTYSWYVLKIGMQN